MGAENGGATGNANGGALLGLFVNMMTDFSLPGQPQQKTHIKGKMMQHISIPEEGERGQQLRPDESAKASGAPSLCSSVGEEHTLYDPTPSESDSL